MKRTRRTLFVALMLAALLASGIPAMASGDPSGEAAEDYSVIAVADGVVIDPSTADA